eukprot:8893877-Lingulodinium_polyedra.AAC.1
MKADLNVVAARGGIRMQDFTGEKQYGGKKGGSTSIPIAEFEYTMEWAEQSGMTFSSVATDIVGAFDEVIKELVMGKRPEEEVEDVRRRLREAG